MVDALDAGAQQPEPPAALSAGAKSVYALGDLTVNTALASLSLIYVSFYLTQVAGLRPALAGLVPLIGRAVDGVSDPIAGRISDRTRWRAGRRRPYFLIGALPFGASFALLWLDVPLPSQMAKLAYYTGVYCALSLSMTVLSVPYLALQPEMALDYDERTSLNTYRAAGAFLGIFAAIAIRPLADLLGGGAEGFARAGLIFGVLLASPWLAVHAASFERREFRERPTELGLVEGLAAAARHRTFLRLIGFYLCGRIAMDLIAALLILYLSFWIGRSGDFEVLMVVFLGAVVLSLPFWLHLARGRDKSQVFIAGCVWWGGLQLAFLLITPDWPRLVPFALAALAAIGYAAVDLMPWSMVGDVIDEDDLATGERREGLYNGVFTFVRKLGGAIGVWLVLSVLDLAGMGKGPEQPESVRQTIRVLAGVAPAAFLAAAVWLAAGYPLSRAAHARVLESLSARRAERGQ